MSVKHNLEQWIAQLDYDSTCDITDRQVADLIRNYAALEARCAAQAAENAGLKASHPQPFGPEMMKALDAYEKHQDETPETGMLDAFFILRDSIRVDTTATDAFLAEVRAQGADECVRQLVISDDDDFSDAPNICAMVAHQLRKGVQS